MFFITMLMIPSHPTPETRSAVAVTSAANVNISGQRVSW